MASKKSAPAQLTSDQIRRDVIQWFHNQNRSGRVAPGIKDLCSGIKGTYGYKAPSVKEHLTYLIDLGYIRKEIVMIRVTTGSTTRDQPRITYRIAAKGIEFVEGKSQFSDHERYPGININAIGGSSVLKPGRTFALLNIPIWAVRHFLHLRTLMEFQNWIVWDALSYPVRLIMPAHYTILCFSKGKPRALPGLIGSSGETHVQGQPAAFDSLKPMAEGYCLRSNCLDKRRRLKVNDRTELTDLWWDIHRLKHNTRRVDHPTQLPPHLLHRLVSLFTTPGELVLDCFNGSGTTTLAADQLGREYFGIEKSEAYHQLSLHRHRELRAGLDPFRKANRKLTAKNSPVPRLPKQRYIVSKKALQLEVKRIANELSRLPTREEVERLGKYPIELYDKYFISWGEVCAAARTTGMSELRESQTLTQTEATNQLDLELPTDR